MFILARNCLIDSTCIDLRLYLPEKPQKMSVTIHEPFAPANFYCRPVYIAKKQDAYVITIETGDSQIIDATKLSLGELKNCLTISSNLLEVSLILSPHD